MVAWKKYLSNTWAPFWTLPAPSKMIKSMSCLLGSSSNIGSLKVSAGILLAPRNEVISAINDIQDTAGHIWSRDHHIREWHTLDRGTVPIERNPIVQRILQNSLLGVLNDSVTMEMEQQMTNYISSRWTIQFPNQLCMMEDLFEMWTLNHIESHTCRTESKARAFIISTECRNKFKSSNTHLWHGSKRQLT